MTDTIDSTSSAPDAAASGSSKKRSGGLSTMLLADLKAMAGGMGIAGSRSMKKAQLVDAIRAAQSGAQRHGSAEQPAKDRPERRKRERTERGDQPSGDASTPAQTDQPAAHQSRDDGSRGAQGKGDQGGGQGRDQGRDQGHGGEPTEAKGRDRSRTKKDQSSDQAHDGTQRDNSRDGGQRDGGQRDGGQRDGGQRDSGQRENRDDRRGPDDDPGGRRNRRRRGRDRTRERQSGGGSQRFEPDTQILDDDVLVPAAGILDVLDNYAFVRTSGYLPGSDDVYVSLSIVRKFGLRRGDAIVGQVRQPREGERKEKFNPMVRIDSVNGAEPEASRARVEFAKLTPLYPSERLRLETAPDNLIGRVIDIAAPIGKGQRGLIVSPSKAGKTMIMQSIANSITTNNPECHLMVVLVDERPEEVTDFERSVKGEVISSTFDRPAVDHTTVAELAIERAKRLVELGHDVVVLLDGITRLGRAYNLAAPPSGRILSGGVDSAALYPPKRFFGAARNIENGGSLTILATALIESGSKMDEVIFEEFKGTGNMEIRLRRDFADKRLFPAIDAIQSGTRREELLMSKEELAIVWKLRRVLSGLDGQQALELLLERLKKSHSNIEFLMQVQKTTPGVDGD